MAPAPRHYATLCCLLLAGCTAASAAELVIPLSGPATISRREVRFRCDVQGPQLGLPDGPFTVTYINGGGNSLAVLPLNGRSLVMANVISADGARYAAGRFIWWDVGGKGATFSADLAGGRLTTSCRPLGRG